MDTIILLSGGHRTLVKGIKAGDLEKDITEWRESREPGRSGLMYVQSQDHPDNGLAIDPFEVVAVVAAKKGRDTE